MGEVLGSTAIHLEARMAPAANTSLVLVHIIKRGSLERAPIPLWHPLLQFLFKRAHFKNITAQVIYKSIPGSQHWEVTAIHLDARMAPAANTSRDDARCLRQHATFHVDMHANTRPFTDVRTPTRDVTM